jgi:chaperonin GroEL
MSLQVKARCEQIRRQIDETDSSYDKEKLQERSGQALWRCGRRQGRGCHRNRNEGPQAAPGRCHQRHQSGSGRRHRPRRWHHPGPPGSPTGSLGPAANLSGEELLGAQIVTRALTAPLNRIAENAGCQWCGHHRAGERKRLQRGLQRCGQYSLWICLQRVSWTPPR